MSLNLNHKIDYAFLDGTFKIQPILNLAGSFSKTTSSGFTLLHPPPLSSTPLMQPGSTPTLTPVKCGTCPCRYLIQTLEARTNNVSEGARE